MIISAFQGPSPAGCKTTSLMAIRRAATASAAMKADFVVFPEMYLYGYNQVSTSWTTVQEVVKNVGKIASETGCGIVLGFAERSGSSCYNSAVAIDANGVLQCHYRKVQLFGPREKTIFSRGDRIPTFRIGNRKAALLICYDVEFDKHVEALAKQSVSVVLVPTANMLPYVHVSRSVVPALAATHSLAIVYANFCGEEGDITYAAESVIVGSNGEVLAKAGQEATLLVCDISDESLDLASEKQFTEFVQVEVV